MLFTENQSGKYSSRILSSALDGSSFGGAPQSDMLKGLGFSKEKILELYRGQQVNYDIKKLHTILREIDKDSVKPLNICGGIPGFVITLGIGREVLFDIHEALSRSIGFVNQTSMRLGISTDALKKLFSELTSHFEPKNDAEIQNVPYQPGGLLLEIKDKFISGQFPQDSNLTGFISRRLLENPNPSSINIGDIKKIILEWLETHSESGANWSLPELRKGLTPLFSFLKSTIVPYAHMLLGLDLHREFVAEKNATFERYNFAFTDIDFGKRFGWPGKTAGTEFANIFSGLKAECEIRGLSKLFETTQREVQAGESGMNFHILHKLGLQALSKEEITAMLRLPQIDFNLRAFCESRGEGPWFYRIGIEALVAGLGQEGAFREKLLELAPYYNGKAGLIAEHVGLSTSKRATFDRLLNLVGVDLTNINFPAGHLLKTFHISKVEVLEILNSQDWKNFGSLKSQMLERMKSRTLEGKPLMTDASVSRAELVWGLDILAETLVVIDSRRVEYNSSIKQIAKSLGIGYGSDRTLRNIYTLAQPVRRSRIPDLIGSLDQRMYIEVPKLRMYPQRVEGYTEIYRDWREAAYRLKSQAEIAARQLPSIDTSKIAEIWHKNKQGLIEPGSRTLRSPTSTLLYISPLWAPYCTAGSFGFRGSLDKAIKDIKHEFPQCRHFWIETGSVIDLDKRRKPVVYAAGLNLENNSVYKVARLIESAPHLFHRSDYTPDNSKAFNKALYQAIEEHGYSWSGSTLSVKNIIPNRIEEADRLKRFEELLWDEIDKEHIFNYFDNLARGLLRSRQASGAMTLINTVYSENVEGEIRSGPSFLEVPFFLSSKVMHDACGYAEIILNDPSYNVEAVAGMAKSLAWSPALREILGYQYFALSPLEILQSRADQLNDRDVVRLAEGLAKRILECRKNYPVQSEDTEIKVRKNPALKEPRELRVLNLVSEASAKFIVSDAALSQARIIKSWKEVVLPLLKEVRPVLMPQSANPEAGFKLLADSQKNEALIEAVLEFLGPVLENRYWSNLGNMSQSILFEFTGDLLAFSLGDTEAAKADWSRALDALVSGGLPEQRLKRRSRILSKLEKAESLNEDDKAKEERVFLERRLAMQNVNERTVEIRNEVINQILAIQPHHGGALAAREITAIEMRALEISHEIAKRKGNGSAAAVAQKIDSLSQEIDKVAAINKDESVVVYLRRRLEEIQSLDKKRSAELIVEAVEQAIDKHEFSDWSPLNSKIIWAESNLEKSFKDGDINDRELFNLKQRLLMSRGRYAESKSVNNEVREAVELLTNLNKIFVHKKYEKRLRDTAAILMESIRGLANSKDPRGAKSVISNRLAAFRAQRSDSLTDEESVKFVGRQEFAKTEEIAQAVLRKL